MNINQTFNQLEPIDCSFMFGNWRGYEIMTGHPMDGLLTLAPWVGKSFFDYEHVHPLVFSDASGRCYPVNAKIGFGLLNNPIIFGLAKLYMKIIEIFGLLVSPHRFDVLFRMLSTKKSNARLRKVTYRGVSTAAMVYDDVPIIDVFRKIDENTVMGMMDMKGKWDRPYYFILRRVS